MTQISVFRRESDRSKMTWRGSEQHIPILLEIKRKAAALSRSLIVIFGAYFVNGTITVKVVCFDRLLQVLILKVLRRELDPRGGVQAVGSDVRTVRGCVAANTQENSVEVHCVSITFLLAFE